MNEVNIIELTDAACKHLQSLTEKHGKEAKFRLSVGKTGCSGYMYLPEIVGSSQEGDVSFTTATGLTVLIDSRYVSCIKGTVVDYVKKKFGRYQLYFRNPNAVSSCGCGESFHLRKNEDIDDNE